MTISLKRILTTVCIGGLLVTSATFGDASTMITKVYTLIRGNNSNNATGLIYNGEIYINLAEIAETTGLSINISDDTITIEDTFSKEVLMPDQDGNLYTGGLKNGLPHGTGTRYLKEGGKYEGEWIDGLYDGYGTLVLANGDIYVGTFSKGFMHGEGKMFYLDGSYYDGHYAYGIKEGFGLLYIDQDNKYRGYWSNGLRNGQGKSYIDGNYKKGIFENNQLIKTQPESSFDF